MSTHKQIDRICAAVMVFALILTIVFMNGTRFGLTLSVDADAEEHSDDTYFTKNDLNAGWDTSLAAQITLEGGSATVSGSGCYVYDGSVVIAQSGKYMVTGELTDGSLIVDANDNSKVWILFDGVSIECTDDACLIVDQADKVFLTLADGSENTLTSGGTLSEEALADNTDGAIFAHDDLTINGSGSLTVNAGYKHGIAANDDLVITGGTITVTAPKDAVHANDSFRFTDAVLNVTAGDDGISVDEENSFIYIKSGEISAACEDEGICCAGDITVDGGEISITTGTQQGHHGIKSGGTFTITDGSILVDECYEGIQAYYIDMQGGDVTIYSNDDGLNASSGSSSEDMFGMGMQGGAGGPGMTEGETGGFGGPGMTEGESGGFGGPGMTEGESGGFHGQMPEMNGQGPQGGMPVMTDETEGENTDSANEDTAGMDSTGTDDMSAEGQAAQSQMPEMNGQGPQGGMPVMTDETEGENAGGTGTDSTGTGGADSDSTSTDSASAGETESEENTEDLPWIHISGGSLLIVNESSMDADGIDSNGDILISGGDVRVSLDSGGGNNAIDYASESGGICRITGGTVIACASYSMAEGFESTSEQGSILYTVSDGVEAGSQIILQDSEGNELLSWTAPCAFSAVTLSCEQMEVGETYTVVLGDNSEDVTLSEISISHGDTQSSMFGGTFNMGGGMQSFGGGGMQPGGEMQMPGGGPQMNGSAEGETEAEGGNTDSTSTDGQAALEQMPQGQMPAMTDETEGENTEGLSADGSQQQMPGGGQQMADTSESEDDAVETQQEEEEITTETIIIWGISFLVLAAGLLIAFKFKRY